MKNKTLLLTTLILVGIVIGQWLSVTPRSTHAQAPVSTRYVSGFPGAVLNDRITAAQAGCATMTPCIIIIDAFYPAVPTETLPAVCTGCTRIDLRVTLPVAAIIPPGSVTFQTSGTCAVGWTEINQVGKYILLTTVAAGGVGTTGGSTSYTPAGSLTMDTMDAHQHEVPLMIDQDNLVVQFPKVGVFGEGLDTGSGIIQTNNDGVSFATKPFDLSEAVSAGTPTGTFNGTPATLQPTFLKLIGCSKN